MKILGIDYGTKRVGLAVADTDAGMAFPYGMLDAKQALEGVLEIIKKENIELIILGESKDFSGNANVVMEEIGKFKKDVENRSSLAVVYEPEFLTSAQAERLQGKIGNLDASAATIILQSYLDKKKNLPN